MQATARERSGSKPDASGAPCLTSVVRQGRSKSPNVMKILTRSNRVYDTAHFGQPEIRLRHRTAKGKKSPSYVLQCGCCNQRLEIHYADDGLEIGGVNGALEDWREVLLPLLLIERKGARFIDVSKKPKGSANKPVQRTGASRFSKGGKRTSSAAGSRR